MNWDAIGASAEAAGALGVIVSLIYLAVQIRNQNRQARLDAVNELTRQRNEYSGNLVDNGEFAEIWIRGINNYHQLNGTERVRVASHLSRMVRVMESLYEHRAEDQLTGESWKAFDRYIREIFLYPGVRQWWETRSYFFTESFQGYIQPYVETRSDDSPNLYLESRDEPSG